MCRSDFIFNNKIFRYSFIFFIAITIYFILPSDTFAAELRNPKIQIWGYENSSDTTPGVLIGCMVCEEIENPTGTIPTEIRVFIPKTMLSAMFQYRFSLSFGWQTPTSVDVWPYTPVLYYYNSPVEGGVVEEWVTTYNTTSNGFYIREDYYKGVKDIPYFNIIDDKEFFFSLSLNMVSGDPNSPYHILFRYNGMNVNTTGVNGDDNTDLGIVIDNSKNDIIANQNNIFNESKENFEEMISDDVSSGNSKFDNFIKNFHLNDNGGISQIVTMPISLVRTILTDNKCHDLHIDDVLGTPVDFPNGCAFWNSVPNDKVILYRMLICGLFSYVVITNIFHDIHRLKNPHDLGVDTLDL